MNVLVTSASRKVALVRTFRDALAREGGGRVVAADTSPLSAALYEADEGVLVPPSADPGFVAALLALCHERQIGLLVPTRDEELPLLAAHREAFARAGVMVMVASPETIASCQDKARFLDCCERSGWSVPPRLDRVTAAASLPVFARPRAGKSSVGAKRIDTRAELDALPDDTLLQPLVASPEFTIDLFADFESRVISVVPRERVRIVSGESYVGRTAHLPALIDAASAMAVGFRLVGHNTLQCFYDGTSPQFIEINPRYGGAAQLGFAAGAVTPWFLVRLALGRPVEPCVGEFTNGLVMLRYTDDRFLAPEELLA